MFADIKLGVKIMKFGLNFKSTMIMLALFLGVGIIFTVIDPISGDEGVVAIGGMYMMMTGVYLGQMIMTSTISRYIQSSPCKRKLQTRIPSIIASVFMVFVYSLYVGIKVVQIKIFGCYATEELFQKQTITVMLTAVMGFAMIIYLGMVYKKYLLGMILLFLTVLPLMMAIMKTGIYEILNFNISFGLAIAIGYAIIILGSFISYFLSCAVFKLDINENSYKNALKRMKE